MSNSQEHFLKKRSLRRLRDNQLEEPYRSWINRDVSLPAEVVFLPRRIKVQSETAVLLGVISFAMCGLFILWAFRPIVSSAYRDPFFLVALFTIAILFPPCWLFWRLCVTIGAYRDQRKGKLRQGVFVGPAGIVVRLSPNRCFVVRLERFLTATTWSSGGDSSAEFFCIDTKDGIVDFSEDSLTADTDAVNHAVFEARMLRDSLAKTQRTGK